MGPPDPCWKRVILVRNAAHEDLLSPPGWGGRVPTTTYGKKHERALVLVADGQVVAEGCDRACRVLGMPLSVRYGVFDAMLISNYCEQRGYGKVVREPW